MTAWYDKNPPVIAQDPQACCHVPVNELHTTKNKPACWTLKPSTILTSL